MLIFLVQATMPIMTTASIVFAKYNGDEGMAAMATILAMLVSLITIQIILYVRMAIVS